MEYLVNYIRQGRETYASVEEVYRVRQGTDRMYLLDYERQMSEFLRRIILPLWEIRSCWALRIRMWK